MEAAQSVNGGRMLRRPEVLKETGIASVSSLYQMMSEGRFPRGVSLGGTRAVAWREADVEAWKTAQQGRATASAPLSDRWSTEVLGAKAALDANSEAQVAALAVHAQAQELVDAAERTIADAQAIEQKLATLEQHRVAALLAERTGEPRAESAATVADEIANLRAESASQLARAAEDRVLLPLLKRRAEEAYKPVAELAAAVPALRHGIAQALAHDLRAAERDAAAPYYSNHCNRRSAEFIAAQLNPKRLPQAIPFRGTVPFNCGLQDSGDPFVLRPETEIPAAETRVWALLAELGVEK